MKTTFMPIDTSFRIHSFSVDPHVQAMQSRKRPLEYKGACCWQRRSGDACICASSGPPVHGQRQPCPCRKFQFPSIQSSKLGSCSSSERFSATALATMPLKSASTADSYTGWITGLKL
ncbi:hypothetical protein MPH_07648 [Macrophomina phaseolina MS6]|uniref:Uncharacterized protein n=1 Tax=Macrophomina phaseolina (strain MS6) TaxID=1126212 RepID=K2QYZ6_MACPH|nr:hypothetical protein MPH_07648 [Macrophomina phaseolina MS6]